MKRIICVLLAAVLLLSGCAAPGSEEKPANSPAAKLTTTAQRRDAAEAKMRKMMTVFWQVDKELKYSYRVNSGDVTADGSYVSTLEPGKIYSGLPYTHGNGDEESFALFGESMDNGVLRMKGITAELLNGSGGMHKANNTARIGNDCADAVFAAWSVSASSITFPNAANMTPRYGCIPVGDYKTVDDNATSYGITKELCRENGEAVMFAAYAQLQKADGLTVNTKGGAHAMLVSEVHPVMDGDKLDPEESYVLVHEQTSRYFKAGETRFEESLGQEVYVMGGVDRKYTFQKLFKAGYLPVTCKEFIDEAPLPVEEITDSEEGLPLDRDSLFAGAFTSNYRILDIRVDILDAEGQVVTWTACCAGSGDRSIFLLSRFEAEAEQNVLAGGLDWALLQRGQTYTARFTCRMSTGAIHIPREVTFTY